MDRFSLRSGKTRRTKMVQLQTNQTNSNTEAHTLSNSSHTNQETTTATNQQREIQISHSTSPVPFNDLLPAAIPESLNDISSSTTIMSNDNNDNENNKKSKPMPYILNDFFQTIKTKKKSETCSTNHPAITNNNTSNETQDRILQQPITTSNNNPVAATVSFLQTTITSKPTKNERWGSSIDSKGIDNFRLFFQNTNSLRLMNKEESKWDSCLDFMLSKQCDIFGFVETCVDWNRPELISKINTATSIKFTNNITTFSNNSFPSISPYQPGGTMQTATHHWAGRYEKSIIDKRNMGRWSGQQFRLKDNKKLIIITAYRPCPNGINDRKISKATSRQQVIMLRQQGFANPNPRTTFIDDIITLISEYEKDSNNHIILMLDANETLQEAGHLCRLLEKTTLIDAFTHHSGIECSLPSYDRGNRRIDYIFTSANMIHYISKVGYLAFNENEIMTDHRGLFIDFHESLIENKVELKRPDKRLIGSKSKVENIYKYKQLINTQFLNHNIYERAKKLKELSITNIDNNKEFENDLNVLDLQVTEIILSAEQQSGTRMHKCEWSIALHQSSVVYKIWRKVDKATTKGWCKQDYTSHLLLQLPEDVAMLIKNNIDSSNPKQEMTKAKKYRRELMKHASRLRSEGLSALANIRQEEGKNEQYQAIKAIQHKETNKKDWKLLRTIFKADIKSSLNYVEIPLADKEGNSTDDPDKASTWKCVSDPNEMENKIIERNIKHFGQANHTAFATQPLSQIFHYDGTGNNVNLLLDGTLDISKLGKSKERGTTTLLQKLNSGNKLQGIDDSISYNEFQRALSKWSEKTSTSPSGRHLGHYRVLLAKDKSNKYDLINMDPNYEILTVYYNIATAALNQGISLRRWQHVTTSMIKKTSGCARINKLRVIHLYEADYNLLLKILWARKLVWNAHDHCRLNSGQSGSRPGCNAIDIVISKEMKYLYSRLTRSALATMDNDAKSCYDRIICSLAMIISQYFGMSERACKMQGTTLEKMKFRLRTALGDSHENYSHSDTTPIHGTGQGSCASPAIWLTISSILMDCLSELAGGMTMINVTNEQELIQWINGFVDDTSLFCNMNLASNDINILKSKMQNDMIIWQELLEASGGKLELSKCFYYILTWSYDKDGNAIADNIEHQRQYTSQIEIPSFESNMKTKIEQKEPSESHKTLGCYKTMTGCEVDEIKYLKEKATRFGQQAKHANLSRKQARMAYTGMFIPSLKYGLPSCSISKKDIDDIQQYPVEVFLSKMGYEKRFPRAIAFAHQDFGGLNMPHLYSEMMGMKLESLISHLQASTELGQAMIININMIQLSSGIIEPIFETNTKIDYIEDNWLLHLRSFIISIGGKIEIENAWKQDIQRINDVCLMNAFIKSGLRTSELRLINHWRKFFKVNTLADICEPDDNSKIQAFYTTMIPKTNRKNISKLNWPNQQKPGFKGFYLWLKALKIAFGFNIATRDITYKLGAWIADHHHIYNQWQSYFDNKSLQMFTTSPSSKEFQIHKFARVGRTSARFHHDFTISPDYSIPTHCIPSNIILDKRGLHTIRYTQPPDPIIQPIFINNRYKCFKDYVKQLPKWKQALVKNLELSTDVNTFIEELKLNDRIIMATDGGTDDSCGTFGVAISNGTTNLAQTQGKLHANHFYSSSFRAEIYALLAGLTCIQCIQEYYQLDSSNFKKIEIHCDNLKVVNRIRQRRVTRRTTNQHAFADVDIEIEIIAVINILKESTSISIDHITGVKPRMNHMGIMELPENTSHPAQLHSLADQLCKSSRKLPKQPYYRLPNSKVHVFIDNESITANYAVIAKRSYHSQDAREFLMKKYSWSESTINSIWWLVHSTALKKLVFHDRVRVQKCIHNRQSTKKRMKYRHPFKSNKCSKCNTIEDENHIMRCRVITRKDIRSEYLQEMSDYLSGSSTPIYVKEIIMQKITEWLELQLPTTSNTDSTKSTANTYLDDAINLQNKIGWDQFIRGRITMEFGYLINRHLHTSNDTSTTAEEWATKLILINFRFILKIWEQRKREEHGCNPTDIESKKKLHFLEEIRHILESFPYWSVVDRGTLPESISELEQKTSHQLELWLLTARIFHSAFLREPVRDSELGISIKKGRTPHNSNRDAQRTSEIEPGENSERVAGTSTGVLG